MKKVNIYLPHLLIKESAVGKFYRYFIQTSYKPHIKFIYEIIITMSEKKQSKSQRNKILKGLKEEIYLDIFMPMFIGIIMIGFVLGFFSIWGVGFATGAVGILSAIFVPALTFIFIKVVPYRNQFISWGGIAGPMLALYVFILTLSPIIDPSAFYKSKNVLKETGETNVVIRRDSAYRSSVEYYKPKYVGTKTNNVTILHKIISFTSLILFFSLLTYWFKKHYFSFENNFNKTILVSKTERNKNKLPKWDEEK